MTEEKRIEIQKAYNEISTTTVRDIERKFNIMISAPLKPCEWFCLGALWKESQIENDNKNEDVAVLEKKIRRYEEMIGSMLAAGQMITQHKEKFDKLRGVDD